MGVSCYIYPEFASSLYFLGVIRICIMIQESRVGSHPLSGRLCMWCPQPGALDWFALRDLTIRVRQRQYDFLFVKTLWNLLPYTSIQY